MSMTHIAHILVNELDSVGDSAGTAYFLHCMLLNNKLEQKLNYHFSN